MIIRRYETKDLAQILLLFYDTIHNINKADYDEENNCMRGQTAGLTLIDGTDLFMNITA